MSYTSRAVEDAVKALRRQAKRKANPENEGDYAKGYRDGMRDAAHTVDIALRSGEWNDDISRTGGR